MIRPVAFKYRCDRCRWEGTAQYNKNLPGGWRRIRGKDVCVRCLTPKYTEEELRKMYPPDPEFGRTQEE